MSADVGDGLAPAVEAVTSGEGRPPASTRSYRVIALESGHLSQTLYLSATEAGLGAFITAAINEKPLEDAFALQPMAQGVMAICGFGWRGEVMDTTELDPQNRIWQSADA